MQAGGQGFESLHLHSRNHRISRTHLENRIYDSCSKAPKGAAQAKIGRHQRSCRKAANQKGNKRQQEARNTRSRRSRRGREAPNAEQTVEVLQVEGNARMAGCARAQAEVKRRRARGGCLGTGSRRRTRQAAKSRGEGQMPVDPRMSEWGNPHGEIPCIPARIHSAGRGTRGTETSKYPEEEKETSIPQVAASERGGAQTGIFGSRGNGPPKRRGSQGNGFGKAGRRG